MKDVSLQNGNYTTKKDFTGLLQKDLAIIFQQYAPATFREIFSLP